MTFAEASLISSMEHNRSLKRLEKINQVINWSQVEEILLSHYTVGTSREGADAYSPLMLLKGLLLQKWYRIDSDPELENQTNDRISFKKFMGLSFDQHSPDHSTFPWAPLQRGDETDQQRRSSAVLPEGVCHQ
jgi:hypothetical protein